MRSYEAIRDELARPLNQAIENAERDVQQAERDLIARQTEAATVRGDHQAATLLYRELDLPQSILKSEITDLESRIRDIQKQLDGKRVQLRDAEGRAEELRQEINRLRAQAGSLDRESERAREEVARRRTALSECLSRLKEVRIRSLLLYVDECFEYLQRASSEGGARQRYEEVKRAYESARVSNPEVMRAHEERVELRRLLESAQVPGVRDALGASLLIVEGGLVARFPGLLDQPPPPEDQEPVETYCWYEAEDDLTRVLLPVPASCWHTPPETLEDPRGSRLCQIIWAFVGALGDPVPSIECERDMVILELHGDQTLRVGSKLFELDSAGKRGAAFLPSSLPAELQEALR